MEFPAFLSKELLIYQSLASEQALFEALVQNPHHLVLFIEAACDDETWTEEHETLMKQLLARATEQTTKGNLTKEQYQRAAHAIQKHYPLLKSLLPTNIHVQLKDNNILLNGILVIASSEFFKQILFADAKVDRDFLPLQQVTFQEFIPVQEFICRGVVPDLGTKGKDELIVLIKRAKTWEVFPLSNFCERMLPKYLNADNIFDMLTLAKKEQWSDFQQSCIAFINERGWGLHLSIEPSNDLFFEFLDFHEPTIEFFEQLRPLIQGIVCSGSLVDEPQFGLALKECPNLYGLDISRTPSFSIQFSEVPKNLQSLNLSECPWFSKDTLKQILNVCPNIRNLILMNNTHLNYTVWGNLTKFKQLKKLNISQCTQIQDGDFNLIAKGLPTLTELSIRNCKKIEEQGFLDMAKSLPKLVSLDLSRTNVSDTVLVEIGSRCRLLTDVNLSGCLNLTEKGMIAFRKQNAMVRIIE